MMTAGRYYVGDLCYVLSDVWDEVCNLTIFGNDCKEGSFTLKDGRHFVMYGTAYGDGTYAGSDGKRYSVDSGTIGCVTMNDSDITPEIQKTLDMGHGHLVHFPENFETKSEYSNRERGVLHFGSLVINTVDENDEEDEYNDDWDNEEEEEEARNDY